MEFKNRLADILKLTEYLSISVLQKAKDFTVNCISVILKELQLLNQLSVEDDWIKCSSFLKYILQLIIGAMPLWCSCFMLFNCRSKTKLLEL